MSEQDQDQHPDIDARARRMGWKPESEWEGEAPKDGFRTAQEFIEFGEKELPVLRERNRELDQRLKESDARGKAKDETVAEIRTTLAEFKDHHEKVRDREYKRAVADVKAKQRQAAEDGDVETYDKLENEAAELEEAGKPKPSKPVKTNGEDVAAQGEYDTWHKGNDWYDDDLTLTLYADQIAPILSRKHKIKGRELYDKIGEAVREKFPEKFGNPRREQAAAVAGAGAAVTGKSGGKTYSNLPPEAKAACDRFVAEGALTKERYVKDYFELED